MKIKGNEARSKRLQSGFRGAVVVCINRKLATEAYLPPRREASQVFELSKFLPPTKLFTGGAYQPASYNDFGVSMNQIKGKFQVKTSPLDTDPEAKQIGAMRMRFDKSFEGGLDATSVVTMMGIMNQDTASGAYVALEKVTGQLASKRGSFCFAHSCSMNNGVQEQSIKVVPGTGTDELKGLSGSMVIDIKDGQHFYTFNYFFE